MPSKKLPLLIETLNNMKAIGVLCLLILTDLFAAGHSFDAGNDLYARYVCSFKPNGYKTLVPGSCSKFYECQFGSSKLRSCPRYFDGIQGMCVVTNPACVEELRTASDCSGLCCGVSSGYVLDPTNSHDYYKCQDNDVIEEQQCLDDLVFNLLTLECDKAVNCGDATSSTPEAVTPPSAITNAPFDLDAYLNVVCLTKPDGFSFSSFTDCNEYYVCRGGKSVAENCGDLYFNNKKGICDLPQNTECYAMRNVMDLEATSEDSSDVREGMTNLSPNASVNIESGNALLYNDEATPENHNESMNDSANASPAIDSEKTATISEETATGTMEVTSINEQTKMQLNEDSTISDSPTNKPSNPEQSKIDQYLSVVCLAKPDWFLLVSFTSCHEFYVCRYGKAQLKSCGEKYFNADKNVCDFPENTQCLLDIYKKERNFPVAPTSEENTPSKPSKAFRDPSGSIPSNIDLYKRFVCRAKPDGELLVSLTQCNEFYICHEGLAVTQSCGRRYFNAAKGICDLPKNTKCLLQQDQTEHATFHKQSMSITDSNIAAPSSSSNPETDFIVANEPSVKEFSKLDLYQRFVCRGKPDGELLVSLQSCHEYYVCHEDLAVSQSCGKLFFNAAKGICDLPENSKCFLHHRDETNPTTEETTVLDLSSTLPINSVEETLTATTSSYDAVSHEKSSHLNGLSQMDLYQRFVCRDKPNGEFLISLQSCNDFYVCHEGAAVVQSCGSQHFNSIKGICDSPKNSKCLLNQDLRKGAEVPDTSLDVSMSAISSNSAPSPSHHNLYQRFVCRDKPNGLFLISPTNCNEYYICHEGLALKQTCGSHYFNYAKESCDLPENTKCLLSKDQGEFATDFFTIDSETPKVVMASNPDLYQRFVCRGKPDGLFLISLQSCQEYYICREGLAVVQSCGQHYFNYAKGICDLPENTKCVLNDNDSMTSSHSSSPNSQNPEEATSTTPSSISLYQRFVCRGKPEGLLMISLNSCNEYYICREGIATIQSCGRKYFNPSKGICDFPKNTKCILNEVQNK